MKTCKLWTGATNNKGYGHGWFDGKYMLAHRRAYTKAYGKIPKGKQVRHAVCNNKLCINPRHLKLGTQADNEQDKHRFGTARYYAQYGPRNATGQMVAER